MLDWGRTHWPLRLAGLCRGAKGCVVRVRVLLFSLYLADLPLALTKEGPASCCVRRFLAFWQGQALAQLYNLIIRSARGEVPCFIGVLDRLSVS